MDDLTASQHIDSGMEFMKFCTSVIENEMKRFKLDSAVYQSFVAELPGTLDVNFDIAYNRCAFMYKYTVCYIYFIKDCFNRFLFEYTDFQNLFVKRSVDSNLRICSLSCGPGLDYLSLILALSEHSSSPSFESVTVLTKHGAWRNTVGIVADTLDKGALSQLKTHFTNFRNIEVVQGNLLTFIPPKGIEALNQSSVVLMVKTLNLKAPSVDEDEIKSKILILISSLKPETAILFIDTKPSLNVFLEVLSKCPGKFLYKPEHFTFKVPFTYSDEFKEKHGSLPVLSCRGAFFVWQKLSVFEAHPNFNVANFNPPTDVKEFSFNSTQKSLNEIDEVVKITKCLNDLILPNNKSFEPNFASNVVNDSHMYDMRQFKSTSSPIETIKEFDINQLFTNGSAQQENSQFNFVDKSLFHSLRKSTSIDNSFLQSSLKSTSSLGENELSLNYPLKISKNEENRPTSISEHDGNEKKINKKVDASQINQTLVPNLESKATQTESIPNLQVIKELTERVRRLVSSLENQVQKNILNDNLNEIPNTNYSPCSINCRNNNSDVDTKVSCCGEIPVRCCSHPEINGAHCCTIRHNPIHRCEMHCSSCIHKCHMHSYRPCENNVAAMGRSSVPNQIVIPLENISNDKLLQIISVIKSD